MAVQAKVLVVALVASLTALACEGEHRSRGIADGGGGELPGGHGMVPASAARLNETASFQGLTVSAQWGPCARAEPCEESFDLSPGGQLRHQHGNRMFVGTLSAQAMSELAAVAISEAVVQQLRQPDPCPAGTDFFETLQIGVAPALWIVGESGFCVQGPIAALRTLLRTRARELFPDSETRPGGETKLPASTRPAHFDESLLFVGMAFKRASEPCPLPEACLEEFAVGPHRPAGHTVFYRLGRHQVTWPAVEDLGGLGELAASAPVIAALRDPQACPADADHDEWMGVSLQGALSVRALHTGGCVQGPIVELRDAARALTARLFAGPDAGAPDQAADHAAERP